MSLLRKLDTRFGDNILWQFIKFNLVSFSITLLQLALANLLPLIFDGVAAKLPPVLRPVFQPDILFEGPSPYVVDGVVTWGYVLPFFLSNVIANIYGYFVNMKTTFRGKGSRGGLVAYLLILTALILGALLTIFGVIIILNPMLGLGVIGVLIGCGVITAGVNLIYLGCSPWIL